MVRLLSVAFGSVSVFFSVHATGPANTMLDLLFQFIIKVSFEMVVEGGVIENSWGITEEAV